NRLAAEIDRLDDGIADEAAERLHLVLDHGGDFGLLHAPQIRQGKAQYPVDEIEAQPAQHPLAEFALHCVDLIFETAVDEDEDQEDQAEHPQIAKLVKLETRKDRDLLG